MRCQRGCLENGAAANLTLHVGREIVPLEVLLANLSAALDRLDSLLQTVLGDGT